MEGDKEQLRQGSTSPWEPALSYYLRVCSTNLAPSNRSSWFILLTC